MSRANLARLVLGLAVLGGREARADGEAADGFVAMPTAPSGVEARVRMSLARADRVQALIISPRLAFVVLRGIELDLVLAGELSRHPQTSGPTEPATSFVGGAHSLGVAVRRPGTTELVVRARVTAPAVSSSFLSSHASEELPYRGATSRILVADPAMAWTAATTLTAQLVASGRTHQGAHAPRWTVGIAAVDVVPSDGGNQLLVRADAGLAGWLSPCWTFAAEVGVISDAFDEGVDEGTDIVPTWIAGLYHHFDRVQIGVATSGAFFVGAPGPLIGPTLGLDLRGSL